MGGEKRRKLPGAAGVIWFQGHFSVFLLQLSCSSLYLRSKEMSLDLVLDFSRRSVPGNIASEKGDFWDARTLPTGQTKCSSSMFDLRAASIMLLKLRLNGVLALTSWHLSLTPPPPTCHNAGANQTNQGKSFPGLIGQWKTNQQMAYPQNTSEDIVQRHRRSSQSWKSCWPWGACLTTMQLGSWNRGILSLRPV